MMRKEIRTRIADPDDAIRAAFDLFLGITRDSEDVPTEFDGATFKPVEAIKWDAEAFVSFEVTLAGNSKGATRPELERVLVDA